MRELGLKILWVAIRSNGQIKLHRSQHHRHGDQETVLSQMLADAYTASEAKVANGERLAPAALLLGQVALWEEALRLAVALLVPVHGPDVGVDNGSQRDAHSVVNVVTVPVGVFEAEVAGMRDAEWGKGVDAVDLLEDQVDVLELGDVVKGGQTDGTGAVGGGGSPGCGSGGAVVLHGLGGDAGCEENVVDFRLSTTLDTRVLHQVKNDEIDGCGSSVVAGDEHSRGCALEVLIVHFVLVGITGTNVVLP